MNKIAYPMLCFCDINLHKMQEHIHFYGGDGYGIAFSKKWGIEMSIQPIQYINPTSPLKKDFSIAFNDSINSTTNDSAQNFLLTQMLYFKPIQGTMDRNNTSVEKNFTDECEWRFIPNTSNTDLPTPFILTIGNQAHKLEMLIKRIPNNSLYTQEFESVDSNVLHINYKISTEKKTPSFTFNLSFNIENAKKAKISLLHTKFSILFLMVRD